MEESLRLTIVQSDIEWENKTVNLVNIRKVLEQTKNATDIIVLPEMFSTGFSMKSNILAETMTDSTISNLYALSKEFNVAIVGSFICKEKEKIYNRGFFITPAGDCFKSDKKHLFRIGNEHIHFQAGSQKTKNIIEYKGWKIVLLICYDLRFPVWSRNADGDEYDLLIYVANWPMKRQIAWDTLLKARAIENLCYVCGVNRVGIDGEKIEYIGGSAVIDWTGEYLLKCENLKSEFKTINLSLKLLKTYRKKFPTWMDNDSFKIEE